MRKYLYKLLDKYILKKHRYCTCTADTLDYAELLWDYFRQDGWSIYKIVDVNHQGRFYFIVRKKL